jgi:hypothetical protein
MTIEITRDGTALPPTTCSAGPTHCDICDEWPARQTELGKRCHMCETREWCAEHPVQLPSNPETVKELADLGYKPAIRHLSQNIEPSRSRGSDS